MKLTKSFIKIIMVAIILLVLFSCEKDHDGIKSKVSFFPDGETILFSATNNSVSNIYTYNLLTEKLQSITKNVDSDYVYYEPSLSPGVSKIVFSAMNKSKYREGTQIYIMDSKGSKIERLTKDVAWDMNPDRKSVV